MRASVRINRSIAEDVYADDMGRPAILAATVVLLVGCGMQLPWWHTESGEGWRLLATSPDGGVEAYAVEAATNPDSLTALWEAWRLPGAAPEVNFEREIVVTFSEGISSGCPEVRFDGVHIGDGVVWSRTSDPLGPRGCRLDLAGAAVFVVALERDALPADRFRLKLREDDIGNSFDVVLP
jgi:hypothetical protein